MSAGCPRHAVASRSCTDVRCLATWKVEGAPTAEQQLVDWVAGNPRCPNQDHECCPDFSCCNPKLLWPVEKRQKFRDAEQGEREKMLMGALGALCAEVGEKAYVTRGDPNDAK